MYLFDFKEFVAVEILSEEENNEVKQYTNCFGEIGEMEDTLFWKEYLSKFEVPDIVLEKLKVQDTEKDDYDWRLLVILIGSSFASKYSLDIAPDGIRLHIRVSNDDGDKMDKRIEELWTYQIARLYEIYLKEQMSLQVLKSNSEEEFDTVERKRKSNLLHFRKKMTTLIEYYGTDEDDIAIADIVGDV